MTNDINPANPEKKQHSMSINTCMSPYVVLQMNKRDEKKTKTAFS